MCEHTHRYSYRCKHTDTDRNPNTCTHTHNHTNTTQAPTHSRTQNRHTNTHTHKHTHTHTHTHTPDDDTDSNDTRDPSDLTRGGGGVAIEEGEEKLSFSKGEVRRLRANLEPLEKEAQCSMRVEERAQVCVDVDVCVLWCIVGRGCTCGMCIHVRDMTYAYAARLICAT